MSMPLHLREQLPVIRAMAWAGLRSANPLTRSRRVPAASEIIHAEIRPASRRLVDDYIAWCGAPATRYRDTLPPHFCAHWAMPMLARLGANAPYNMLSVLNQGARLQINAALPRDVPLQLRGSLESVSNDGHRVRIHSRVIASTADTTDALILDSYAALMLKRSPSRKPAEAEPDFKTIGHWSADADDGLRFAKLTGDFNPIHTLPMLARHTRFHGCILHGFAGFARSYETLLNSGADIRCADIRFIKPLPLPSRDLEVQIAKADDAGWRALRLRSSQGAVHLAGQYQERSAR